MATSSNTLLAAGESCIWATALQSESRGGGTPELQRSPPHLLWVPASSSDQIFSLPSAAKHSRSCHQSGQLSSKPGCVWRRIPRHGERTHHRPAPHPRGTDGKQARALPARFRGAQSQPCTVTAREPGAASQHSSAQFPAAGKHQKYLPGMGDPTFPTLLSRKFPAHLPQSCKGMHPAAPKPGSCSAVLG